LLRGLNSMDGGDAVPPELLRGLNAMDGGDAVPPDPWCGLDGKGGLGLLYSFVHAKMSP
jgi:hypothetical protein